MKKFLSLSIVLFLLLSFSLPSQAEEIGIRKYIQDFDLDEENLVDLTTTSIFNQRWGRGLSNITLDLHMKVLPTLYILLNNSSNIERLRFNFNYANIDFLYLPTDNLAFELDLNLFTSKIEDMPFTNSAGYNLTSEYLFLNHSTYKAGISSYISDSSSSISLFGRYEVNTSLGLFVSYENDYDYKHENDNRLNSLGIGGDYDINPDLVLSLSSFIGFQDNYLYINNSVGVADEDNWEAFLSYVRHHQNDVSNSMQPVMHSTDDLFLGVFSENIFMSKNISAFYSARIGLHNIIESSEETYATIAIRLGAEYEFNDEWITKLQYDIKTYSPSHIFDIEHKINLGVTYKF